MKVASPLVNLTGGEVSPRLNGRPDVAKQRNGLRTCENFQVVVHGGARKRSGTQYVSFLPGTTHILQPFLYSTSDSYMLAIGAGYMYIARDRGLLTEYTKTVTGISNRNFGIVTTSDAHGLVAGDTVIVRGATGMVEVNNRIFIVTNVTATTFELQGVNTTSYGVFTGTALVSKLVVVPHSYTAAQLQEMRFAQYNDVLYITHKDHPVRKLSRLSNTSWSLSAVSLTTGPFRTINGEPARVISLIPFAETVVGATRANPCVITTNGVHKFAVGNVVSFGGVGGMTQLNGNAYDVIAVTSNTVTISVNSSAFGAFTSGGIISYARTAWNTFPVGTKLYMQAPFAPFASTHVGSLWRLSEAGGGTSVAGPNLGDETAGTLLNNQSYTTDGKIYGISNVTGTNNWKFFNRVPAHESGSVRVVGSLNNRYFTATFLHPGYSVVQVLEYVSSTVVLVQVVRYQMPESILSAGTSFWEEGAWSEYRRYPRCCAFFEQRLWLAGSDSEPNVIWSSKSSGFENFEDGTEDNDAIVYRASSGFADTIRWLSGGRVLTAGTSQGEYAIAASNQNEALTPSNLRMLLQTTYGTSDCPPVRVNEAVLYPQRNGTPSNASRKLREFTYDFTSDTFNSVDLTVFAEHVTGSGIKRLAYAMQPDPMVWAVREDGQLACCTYERLQEVIAWQRHRLGGTNALAKSVGVCPGPSGDDVWIVTSRTGQDGTEYSLEVFHPAFEPVIHDKDDAVFVDAALTYEGASTTTISGLWHLRGQTVNILNNGNVETTTVSSSGTVTLSRATTKAHIGLPYTAILETQDIEAGAQAGTAQSRMKRISDLWLRVLGSLGGTVGMPRLAGSLTPLKYRDADDVMSSSPPLYDGLIRIEAPGEQDREARIRIEHSDPLPFFVTAFVSELNTQG